MKISFIITYYNQKDFVKQSIESILAQDLDYDYEIIIGDDGSSDGTLEVANEYMQMYPGKIKIFTMPRDQNRVYNPIHRASANRLNALRNAKGEYFCVLDGDDAYVSNTFANNAVKILDSNKSLMGCFFDFNMVYKDRVEKFNNSSLVKGVISPEKYLLSSWVPAAAIVFRNVLQEKDFLLLEKSKNFDDNVITVYMLSFGDFYYLSEIAFAYKQNDHSVWNSADNVEKNLLNAMDFEIMSHVVPKFRRLLFRRQLHGLQAIFNIKGNLENLLGSKYDRYLLENAELNNAMIVNFLRWNNINFVKKCYSIMLYKYYCWRVGCIVTH
jgi:glycosyltransferase involved in cell wall biosynthesis